jgi:hypothetical protein
VRLFLGLALFALATPAIAAPLSSADKAHLEGVWRSNDNAASDTCGTDGKFQYGVEITIEFKLSGGQIYYEDQAEGSGIDQIVSSSKTGDTITLEQKDRHPGMQIKFSGKDNADIDGRMFGHCIDGAPRTAIVLTKEDVTYLSTGMVSSGISPYYGAYFVDARDPGACKAKVYQALHFNLINPAFPTIAHVDSDALKAKLDANKKPGVAIDEDARWAMDGAHRTATGWQFKAAELAPPNSSRGDAVTIDVTRTKTGIAIPAWKRSYTRCVFQ